MSKSTRIKDFASKVSDIYHLEAFAVLAEPGFNERADYGDINALANDIAENGIIVPFIVRKPPGANDFVYMVSGHRRRRAVDLLIKQGRWNGLIPCRSDDRNSTPVDRLFTQLSENSGKPLTLLEKGRLYQRIRKEAESQGHKITGAEIASRSQTTKQAVSDALTLIEKASPHLIKLIESEKISATTALEIIRQSPDHKDQDTAADQALETAASTGKTKASPKHLPKTPTVNPPNKLPNDTPGDNSGATVYESKDDDEEEENDQEKENDEDSATKNQEQGTNNSPADPGAMERIKNTPSTGGGGGSGFNTGGGGQGGNGSIETRLKNIEKCLETIADGEYEINETRKETVELIINILNGDSTTAALKSHLRL